MNKKRLKNSRLYLILDKGVCGKRSLSLILRQALQGGVDIVQYRDKKSSRKSMIKNALALHRLTTKFDVPLLVNDRLDVAMASGAEGIHLGQDDLPVELCRRMLGPAKLIGISCHDKQEIKRSQNKKVDYVAFGPVFPTALKPNLQPRGIKTLKKCMTMTRKPLFAIGGINKKNIEQLACLQNVGAVVCREICRSKDPLKTTKALKQRLIEIKCTKH
ncbi:MAG: thiamine phosphate synthase [Candidatus Omnitrophota bacterium]